MVNDVSAETVCLPYAVIRGNVTPLGKTVSSSYSAGTEYFSCINSRARVGFEILWNFSDRSIKINLEIYFKRPVNKLLTFFMG